MSDDAPWEAVPRFTGYERNRFGEFRSWLKRGGGRKDAHGGRTFSASPRPVKPWKDRDGYLRVNLYDAQHKQKAFSVAATVLEMNVGPRPAGMVVCHSPDRTRTNNAPSNLRWGTHRDNIDDMMAHGTQAKGLRHGRHTKPESTPRGDKHPSRTKPGYMKGINAGEKSATHKLTEADVARIRAAAGQRPRRRGVIARLARELGVCIATVWFAAEGVTWKHSVGKVADCS